MIPQHSIDTLAQHYERALQHHSYDTMQRIDRRAEMIIATLTRPEHYRRFYAYLKVFYHSRQGDGVPFVGWVRGVENG